MGITAISWVNSTEKTDLPPCVRINPFSERVCNTIAVEESASVRPIASATRHGWS